MILLIIPPKIINMFSKFESMWDGHLGRTKAAQHWIKLSSEDTQPIHSIQLQVRPRVRKSEKKEIAKMLEVEFIKSAQTEWAPPIGFDPKAEGMLWFSVAYQICNAVAVSNSYPILQMEESSTS